MDRLPNVTFSFNNDPENPFSLDDISPPFDVDGIIFRMEVRGSPGLGFGCTIFPVKRSKRIADNGMTFPGVIHLQFDVVKRDDQSISLSYKGEESLYKYKGIDKGKDKGWIPRATIQDYDLKVKVCFIV
jgi:hypothetical protein